ncbi:hypothetical protein AB0C27_24020 [Nonomuraea sp. NPDC048882]|uniref:hypothetical protein n=1 Tax=unclassified Nonomuraea TaxID=2593643 RepID=UPI000A6853C5
MKSRLLIPLACLLLLIAVTPAAAAAPAREPLTQAEAMRRLFFMVGAWAGTGWTILPSGARQEFLQTEWIRYQAGDLVISVEGQGRDKADPGTIVDSALAVINYNDVTGQYRWEAFSRGFVTTVEPVVGDHRFEWSLRTPSFTTRYTLTFTDTAWHEIGETSVDGGQSWRQNFQMDLRRLY